MVEVGHRVKLILDKEQGPDRRWHGKTGMVTRITAAAAGDVTGDEMDSLLFEMERDEVKEQPNVHFRWDDIEQLQEYRGGLVSFIHSEGTCSTVLKLCASLSAKTC